MLEDGKREGKEKERRAGGKEGWRKRRGVEKDRERAKANSLCDLDFLMTGGWLARG